MKKIWIPTAAVCALVAIGCGARGHDGTVETPTAPTRTASPTPTYTMPTYTTVTPTTKPTTGQTTNLPTDGSSAAD